MQSGPTSDSRGVASLVLALLRFAGVCVAGLAADLYTKSLAVAHLKGQESIEFIPGWLHFDYTENPGAVFGLGAGNRWLFVAVSIVAIGFLSYLFVASRREKAGGAAGYQVILGVLLAGVLGNLYDRIVYGHVRDMLHGLPGWRWPEGWSYIGGRPVFPYIFNVADVLLCTGVGLMLLHTAWGGYREMRQRRAASARPETGHA